MDQILIDAMIFSPEGIRHLVEEVGASQVVYGTDIPLLWPDAVDNILADTFSDDAKTQLWDTSKNFPSDWQGLDIGPRSVAEIEQVVSKARTIVWNGPAGVFEFPRFAVGTNAIARAVAANKGATSIIGGGDSVSAINQAGVADEITHISTGGGASLEFLEGKKLPGVEVNASARLWRNSSVCALSQARPPSQPATLGG